MSGGEAREPAARMAFDYVLVIDDNAVDRRFSLRTIRRSGVVRQALGFRGGEEALDWLRSGVAPRVQLIFLDIRMPRMDGFEFLAALRAGDVRLAPVDVVVMLTTSLDPADHARSERFPEIRAYIDKPLTEDHLREFARVMPPL